MMLLEKQISDLEKMPINVILPTLRRGSSNSAKGFIIAILDREVDA